MTVDLSILESLGINLYSNAAAVLTELVANSYDADATRVRINWKRHGEIIVVADNGVGMNRSHINERFLAVGYKKRDTEGDKSKNHQRLFMERRGIGTRAAVS